MRIEIEIPGLDPTSDVAAGVLDALKDALIDDEALADTAIRLQVVVTPWVDVADESVTRQTTDEGTG